MVDAFSVPFILSCCIDVSYEGEFSGHSKMNATTLSRDKNCSKEILKVVAIKSSQRLTEETRTPCLFV